MMDRAKVILEFDNGKLLGFNEVDFMICRSFGKNKPINIYLFGKVSRATLCSLRLIMDCGKEDNIFHVEDCNMEDFRINEFNHAEAKMERLIGIGELTYD